jgi:hypothetical protein
VERVRETEIHREGLEYIYCTRHHTQIFKSTQRADALSHLGGIRVVKQRSLLTGSIAEVMEGGTGVHLAYFNINTLHFSHDSFHSRALKTTKTSCTVEHTPHIVIGTYTYHITRETDKAAFGKHWIVGVLSRRRHLISY